MTNQEYYEQIETILKRVAKEKIMITEDSIAEMKKMKPIGLYVQMIEILNQINQGSASFDLFDFEKDISIVMGNSQLQLVLELLQDIYEEEQRWEDVKRIELKINFLKNNIEKFCEEYDKLEMLCKSYIEKQEVSFSDILKQLFILEDTVALKILSQQDKRYEKFFQEPNMEFLEEELNESNAKYMLIESESNQYLVRVLAQFLSKKGNEVFLIKCPLCYEADNIRIEDTVAISVDSIQKMDDMIVITPIKVISESKGAEDNISYLMEYVNNHYNNGFHINVLGQGYQIDEISVRPFTNKKMTRLSEYYYEKREYNIALARYGDYIEYISKIYKEDCRKLLYRKPTKKFSIVIPARDSIETLQHTIRTCLEQSYTGEYEILVSDNSVKNSEVYKFCKKMSNPKIVYVKTPRDLCLTKSFEYAYLHTSGEYVFSIGSDDGVLPWALDVLQEVTERFTEEPIINWARGFYAWPGFNYGQQHQISIPNKSTPDKIIISMKESTEYLGEISENPHSMYLLPMLYINSCFRRDYMHTMLEKTGELFDAKSQDVYIGLEMIALNDRILNISMSLTIAGMSSKSVGANADKMQSFGEKETKRKNIFGEGNVGINVHTMYEHFVPVLGSDISALYFALMRAVSKGLFSIQLVNEMFDWKVIYKKNIEALKPINITYYDDLYKIRHAAMLHEEDFLAWCDVELEKCMQLRIIDEDEYRKMKEKKTYKNGLDEKKVLHWDASEFGVKNIYDATKLFERLIRNIQ